MISRPFFLAIKTKDDHSIKFADHIEFSATNLQEKPLLTVNVPLGLQYGKNPATINVKGKG